VAREFRWIALTAPGSDDASVAIAASRAGAAGVLDLEYFRDLRAARAAVEKLARLAGLDCGVKFDPADTAFVPDLIAHWPDRIGLAILKSAAPALLEGPIRFLRARAVTILLEATGLAEARLGEQLRVDGLVAKGSEAGGRVGEEGTFVLLQRLLANISLPIWPQGGIGLNSAAACYEAGAAGAVLDSQLALTRESPLPEAVRSVIARSDGSETVCIAAGDGQAYRMFYRPGFGAVEGLRRAAALAEPAHGDRAPTALHEEVRRRVGWGAPDQDVWLLGQDCAFGGALAERFKTVGGVIEGLRQAVGDHVRAARAIRPLDEGSPLAQSHETRYPIVQGPMTRVSDRAAFALEVARGGGLPFLALALMRSAEVGELLEETARLLADRPWGVGILGFVPLDLRQEQIEVIRAHRPPFALIAGGRPDQALELEQAGIRTYLHVPSPGLLKLFAEGGARRFIFEGRECGGHVGPRSSFVLWEASIEALLGSLPAADLADCHVLFAGGVHDALSASMVATLAAPLAERGVKIGVLLGTAYLFTEEALASGAITANFQREAIRCTRTVLLESGPGHATRCVESPYALAFEREKRRLEASGLPSEEVRRLLEECNIGRLRIASKGIAHHPRHGLDPAAPKFAELSADEQRDHGLYMIGQVAALRSSTVTIEELHRDVCLAGSRRLDQVADPALDWPARRPAPKPCDVAIVGMACLLPKAPDLPAYWENILQRVDAITEVPADRWDWRQYYDPDPASPDKISSRWGGFLDDVVFDPMIYGIPPSTIPSVEPLQLLTLEVVRAALADAGYADREFDRRNTAVILGVGGGIADLGQQYAVRSGLPMFVGDPATEVLDRLPAWTEDSFAGILLNVAAGRVANRFDLGGVNFTVDAACASSLAAVHLATRELEAGTSNVVIAGGADTVQNPFGYLCFTKTRALSPRGRCRPLDDGADGIVISEGLAVVVLKRLADAERDGDRIYAVIKGVAGSSDGRDRGLTAPSPEGQAVALERAYDKAGFSPSTVGLIECHGTGTVAGDQAEIQTLKQIFERAGAPWRTCAVGSVKSMIGHTKCTAGVAGLIKVALALHHRVLPPTINVGRPNIRARFSESPFYVNTEARAWLPATAGHPRRAGVSAFGFGGTNFHAVLEEYTGGYLDAPDPAVACTWPGEILCWAGDTRDEIAAAIEGIERALGRGARPRLRDLAATLWQAFKGRIGARLVLVVTSLEDLRQKLARAREYLLGPAVPSTRGASGVYFAERPLGNEGSLAFLFPGQGSQYPGMLRDLTLHFREVREAFELADRVLADRLPSSLGSIVFPPPSFDEAERDACQRTLARTNVAQAALGAACMGLVRLLAALKVQPDLVAGHSYGEYAALGCAGVLDEATLYELSEARGRCIIESADQAQGVMAAVAEGRKRVEGVLEPLADVWIANVNAPRQTVIAGREDAVGRALNLLEGQGIAVRPIPVACAFHSPVVAPARGRLAEVLSGVQFRTPQRPVFSNVTACRYPEDPGAIAALLRDHLLSPVRFAEEVQAMYESGARIFVEVGPRNVLTALVGQILEDRPHLAVATDTPPCDGILHLQHALGQLAAHGVPMDLGRLYRDRGVRALDLSSLDAEGQDRPPPAGAWYVNGGRSRLVSGPAGSIPAREASRNGNGQVVVLPSHAKTPGSSIPENGVLGATTLSTAAPPREWLHAASGPILPRTSRPVAGADIAPSGARSGPTGDGVSRVMVEFERLMSRLAVVQRDVMLDYLNRSPRGSDRRDSLPEETRPVEAHSRENRAPGDATPAPPSPVEGSQPPSRVVTHAPGDGPRTGERSLAAALLRIVSERTGYPLDVLDLDHDLEADLGIDSIKRVEILATFRRACLPDGAGVGALAMEDLATAKTLRKILEVSGGHLVPSEITAVASPSIEPQHDFESAPEHESLADASVPRFLLSAVEAPLRADPGPIGTDGVFLITDDQGGVARLLSGALRDGGAKAVIVQSRHRDPEEEEGVGPDGNDFSTDLTNPGSVTELIESLRRRFGRIAGVVHLLPLRSGNQPRAMEAADWRERLNHEVKGLFQLAKAASPDLVRVAEGDRGWFFAAVAMGGAFASNHPVGPFFPGHGGVAGLVKTLALEWPRVHCKVIDLATLTPARQVERLMAELVARDEEVEVGYAGDRRLVLRARPVPVFEGPASRPAFEPNDVVLLTGGARGITAAVALELARCYRPKLILVGRSPLPRTEESPRTCDLTRPRDLRAALIDGMRHHQEAILPSRVEDAYARLLREREIRGNLEAIRRAGGKVFYEEMDVRDDVAFGDLIDRIYAVHGRLDGVIHGAGTIDDKLIETKSSESFDRVFDTKVSGAVTLARKLRLDSVRFLVFFSSVAGRFGNRGQSDYVAANEVLNKMAVELDRRCRARVVAIDWGPWTGTGMVSAEVGRQFEERSIPLIDARDGPRAMDRELRLGQKGESEVILGAGPWGSNAPHSPVPTLRPLPLFQPARPQLDPAGAIEAIHRLDPAVDFYLRDHRLDGIPVLPAAFALELMAEAARERWPDRNVIRVMSFRVLSGVVLRDGPLDVRVVARPRGRTSPDRPELVVDSEIRAPKGRGPIYYRAELWLAAEFPDPPPTPRASPLNPQGPAPDVDELYRRVLFHGPRFRSVREIEGLSPAGIRAVLAPSSPQDCVVCPPTAQWVIDPIVFDAGPQLAIVWARAHWDMTALPSGFRSYRSYGELAGSTILCHFHVQHATEVQIVRADVTFSNPQGRLLGMVEGLECHCSRSLNRVTAQRRLTGMTDGRQPIS
jgi:acyl transferase domain-containing protein/NAD(P)H-dependent flavin oxidoreductase YrpB (nitropropane dioxygenase family)/NAD(P)-dependent dehydrogenase (short-subunit alcohol dehydrogenase family)